MTLAGLARVRYGRVLPSEGGGVRGLLMAVALVAAALLMAWLDGDSGIRTVLALREDVAAAQARVEQLRSEIQQLEELVASSDGSAFARERAIREELDWVRPGEILVRMPEDAGLPGVGSEGKPPEDVLAP